MFESMFNMYIAEMEEIEEVAQRSEKLLELVEKECSQDVFFRVEELLGEVKSYCEKQHYINGLKNGIKLIKEI